MSRERLRCASTVASTSQNSLAALAAEPPTGQHAQRNVESDALSQKKPPRDPRGSDTGEQPSPSHRAWSARGHGPRAPTKQVAERERETKKAGLQARTGAGSVRQHARPLGLADRAARCRALGVEGGADRALPYSAVPLAARSARAPAARCRWGWSRSRHLGGRSLLPCFGCLSPRTRSRRRSYSRALEVATSGRRPRPGVAAAPAPCSGTHVTRTARSLS
jgi:hypothetical protein